MKSGDYLIIKLTGTEDQIRIYWFRYDYYQLDQIELADGNTYTAAEFMSAFIVYSESSDGDDTLTGYDGVDEITAGAGNDTITAKGGNDSLDGGDGNDTLNGDAGDDQLIGGEGNDFLYGGNENDHLTGGNGDDALNGDSGEDVLIGGLGNDALDGGAGNDRYLFNVGDGQDSIRNYDPYGSSTYTDTLVFGEGITLEDFTLSKSGNSLIIDLLGSGDRITIVNMYSSSYYLDQFELDDGTVYGRTGFMNALPITTL